MKTALSRETSFGENDTYKPNRANRIRAMDNPISKLCLTTKYASVLGTPSNSCALRYHSIIAKKVVVMLLAKMLRLKIKRVFKSIASLLNYNHLTFIS